MTYADREGELSWCIVINGETMSARLWSVSDSTWVPLALDLKTVTPLELDFDRRTLWCARSLAGGGSELVPYDCKTQTLKVGGRMNRRLHASKPRANLRLYT